MRGKRARAIRREALPADLRDEMKATIRPLAAGRAETIDKSRAKMETAISKAQAEHRTATGAAWDEFEKERALVVETYEEKARERTEKAA